MLQARTIESTPFSSFSKTMASEMMALAAPSTIAATKSYSDFLVANPSTPAFYALARERGRIVIHIAIALTKEYTVTGLQCLPDMLLSDLKQRLASRWGLTENEFVLCCGGYHLREDVTLHDCGWRIDDKGICLHMCRSLPHSAAAKDIPQQALLSDNKEHSSTPVSDPVAADGPPKEKY